MTIRILHLEDDPLDAELVRAALEADGIACDVMRVDDRAGFVYALESGPFDVILADYSLPSFNGVSALEIASEKCPDIPYIFVSGRMGEDVAVETLKLGAVDYVLKTNLSRLAPAVRRALREAGERAAHRRADANVRKLNRVYAVLSAVNHLIIRARDRQELFDGACRIAVDEGLFLMAWVGLVDESAKTVVPVACTGCEAGYLKNIRVSTDEVPEGMGPTGRTVREGTRFINNDTEHNPVMGPWRDEALRRGYRSSASFPLMYDGKTVGAFTVYAAEEGSFDEEEAGLLDELAADISHAMRSMEQEYLRKQAEAVAHELGDRLRAMVEEALVGFYVLQGSRFVYANRKTAEMLGYTKEELLNITDVAGVVHPDDREMVRESMRRRLAGEERTAHYEARMLRKDGGAAYLEVYSMATDYLGKPSIIGSVMDITARKELERQKADFYAMLTHDLKSPLTAVMGYADFMLAAAADRLDADLLDMIASIRGSGDKLLRMVEDFLALSRMESGVLALKRTQSDLSLILWEARKEVVDALAEKRLVLRVEAPDGLPLVMIDQRLVLRAVSNLLHNAVNYTPAGGRITVSAQKEGDDVVVSVSDTGPGISPEEQERVFDKYYRSPRTAGVRGTGLGLAIVKAVSEAHGGRVELVSEVGKGSTFRLVLPTG